MSKAVLLLPLLLTSCDDITFEDEPKINTAGELASLPPWVACIYLLRLPIAVLCMGVALHGFVLVKKTTYVTRYDKQDEEEEEEAR